MYNQQRINAVGVLKERRGGYEEESWGNDERLTKILKKEHKNIDQRYIHVKIQKEIW